MAWTIEFAESVGKSVEKLDSGRAGASRPKEPGQAADGPLDGLWRYRVGDYRIICEILDRKLVILVVKIDHRRDVYR